MCHLLENKCCNLILIFVLKLDPLYQTAYYNSLSIYSRDEIPDDVNIDVIITRYELEGRFWGHKEPKNLISFLIPETGVIIALVTYCFATFSSAVGLAGSIKQHLALLTAFVTFIFIDALIEIVARRTFVHLIAIIDFLVGFLALFFIYLLYNWRKEELLRNSQISLQPVVTRAPEILPKMKPSEQKREILPLQQCLHTLV